MNELIEWKVHFIFVFFTDKPLDGMVDEIMPFELCVNSNKGFQKRAIVIDMC